MKLKEIAREEELMETTIFLDEKKKKFKSTYKNAHIILGKT